PSKGRVPQQGHQHGNDEEDNAVPAEVMLRRCGGGASGSVGDFFWPRDLNRCIHGCPPERNSPATTSALGVSGFIPFGGSPETSDICVILRACDHRSQGFAQGQCVIMILAARQPASVETWSRPRWIPFQVSGYVAGILWTGDISA